MSYSAIDTLWILMAAVLVFFMQPGFAMLEAGLTRAKNAGNIVMKNFMDFALATLVFWLDGFGPSKWISRPGHLIRTWPFCSSRLSSVP